MAKTIFSLKGFLVMFMALSSTVGAMAWDTEPDPETGKYDKYFDRPTHFPDWSQPVGSYQNNMALYVAVKVGKSDNRLENYEIAVYDQNNKLRHCSRSYPNYNNLCALNILGDEGDVFHFEIIYGDDFENPTITPIPDYEEQFSTNRTEGNLADPYWMTMPAPTILDEESSSAIEAETDADVRVLRTINANEWGTICLPFAMSEEQVKSAFGDDVKLGDFTRCDVEYDDDDIVQSIKVEFSLVTSMKANHPYIIKVKEKVTEFELTNVTIDPDPDGAYVKKRRDYFYGNYKAGFLVPKQCLFLSGGKFWYSVGLTPMMAYRAYFDLDEHLPEIEDYTSRISISITDESNGIASTSVESCQPGSVYTLDGRKVDGNTLRKGLYIIGGKKYVIK